MSDANAKYDEAKLKSYLDRIGIERKEVSDAISADPLGAIRLLMRGHLLHVPFENTFM